MPYHFESVKGVWLAYWEDRKGGHPAAPLGVETVPR